MIWIINRSKYIGQSITEGGIILWNVILSKERGIKNQKNESQTLSLMIHGLRDKAYPIIEGTNARKILTINGINIRS